MNSYQGTSPDEICLVSGAKQMGSVFLGRTSNSTIMNILDQETEFKLLGVFEFDNSRKMMSVIVKDGPVFKLYSKGADSAILGRLRSGPQPFLTTAKAKLSEYSKAGLRTLCMGMRVLSEAEVDRVQKRLLEISVLGANRDKAMCTLL